MLLGAWAGRQTAGADERHRGVPGSPGVETSPSSARGVGLIPGSHVPRGQNTKTIRQKQYWSTSKKDFLNGPHQKKNKKNLQKRNTSKPDCPVCSSPATTSCFPLHQPPSSVSVPRIIPQLYPVLIAKKNTKGPGEMDWLIFLIKGPKLTNCSGPPSRGRKFQVTVRASPIGAKLEKVHFNRTSVPLTASSTRGV